MRYSSVCHCNTSREPESAINSARTSAAGLQMWHHHGSQYMIEAFQAEPRFLGITSSLPFIRPKKLLLRVQACLTVDKLRVARHGFALKPKCAATCSKRGATMNTIINPVSKKSGRSWQRKYTALNSPLIQGNGDHPSG